MTVFLVLQKPFSKYSDVRGHGYEYPTSIPNGRNIEEGDYLVCCLTKKNATDGQRVFGVGESDSSGTTRRTGGSTPSLSTSYIAN